jgi:predicted transcriptional regulator of viral defense system
MVYILADWEIEDELEEVVQIVPNGVVCLLSAWNYHELSNYVPPEYHVAIEKSQKLILPDYPPIQLYFWTQKYWELGVTSVKNGNTTVKIYDKEKCV